MGYIVNAQNYITSWQLKNQIDSHLFEVPSEFLEPLANLSKLTLYLLSSTRPNLNDKQLQALTKWLYVTAFCYCFIQEFIRLKCDSKVEKTEFSPKADTEVLAYQFYFYASIELRTHITTLHAFSQMFKIRPSDYSVFPLVPEYEDTLLQNDYWIDQLLEFSGTWTEEIKKYQ